MLVKKIIIAGFVWSTAFSLVAMDGPGARSCNNGLNKSSIMRYGIVGALAGMGLYAFTVKGLADGEVSVPLVIASAGIGAGCLGFSSYINTMNKKRRMPSEIGSFSQSLSRESLRKNECISILLKNNCE